MTSSPVTVLERIRRRAAQCPDTIALRRCDGTSVVRYRHLVGAADTLAAELGARSVRMGSRVLVISDNGPETYVAVLACARVGAIAVMVDGALPVAAVDRFYDITGPDALVMTPSARLQHSELSPRLQALPSISVELSRRHSEPTPVPPQPVQDGEHPLAMIFTSGTTGTPKAVLLPNRTFYAVADILQREQLTWVDWVVGETTYSPLPATHIGGLWWILNCLMQGVQCITGGENTSSIATIIAENGVATTCLVPTLLSRLVAELKSTGARVPVSLRMVGYGGSRAVASDIAFIEAGGVHTAQVYGLSETGCTALCLPTERGSVTRIEAGAVGRPYPGVAVHLDGDGSGPPSRSGAGSASSGTLWIRSPANMLGYWNDPMRSAEVLVDGWVNTGDLLDRGDDGFFYIRGRSAEMIISGGVNVAPDEVDRIAEGVTGVREAACFEIPDDEFGALVGLAVVPSTSVGVEAARSLKHTIAARFRDEAEPMARPSTITFVRQIPRTPSGKVMRAALSAEHVDG